VWRPEKFLKIVIKLLIINERNLQSLKKRNIGIGKGYIRISNGANLVKKSKKKEIIYLYPHEKPKLTKKPKLSKNVFHSRLEHKQLGTKATSK